MRTQTALALTLASLAPMAHSQSTSEADPASAAARFWWSDYDGDGDVDAFVVHPTDGVRLLAGYGDGSFEDVTARVGLDGLEGVSQALWNDVDGDGRPELFTVAPGGASRLHRLQGEVFVEVSGVLGGAREASVLHGEWIDVDADGRDDLHLSTARRELVLHNLGGLRFEELDLGVEPVELRGSAERTAWTEEDRARTLQGAEPGSGVLDATAGIGTSSVAPAAGRGAAAGAPFCWDTLADQATGNCLSASSVPTVGSLFPLGPQFSIDLAGRVGIGTLTPGAALDVLGSVRSDQQLVSTAASGPPLAVSSNAVVTNLNADLLDGMDAAQLAVLGSSISEDELEDAAVTSAKLAPGAVGGAQIAPGAVGQVEIGTGAVGSDEILDGSITSADLGPGAIDGGSIVPNFGAQPVTTSGTVVAGEVAGSDIFAVKGIGLQDPTRGYLGVQGEIDFDGILDLDVSGYEVGVLGVSEGGGPADNFGVLGQANGAGVRGQSSADPSTNFGELGRNGTGVWGEGAVYGGHFESSNVAARFVGNFDGIWASTDYDAGYGVYGSATASSGFNRGLYGKSSSSSGTGVHGWASASTGTNYGVYGQTTSTSGRAVYGHATAASGNSYGVFGRSSSTTGRGVTGNALATSGVNYGVQGRTYSPSGWGTISYGASGSTGQKSFIQPHPSDPTKEIHFVSLEGNESGTYFRGSSVLAGGRVEIPVPEEFRLVSEAEGLTVQLTPRGPGADLWVVSVDLDRFVVSGAWDVEFDYQVNGIRRGFSNYQAQHANNNWVPEERGVPFGTQYPEDLRRILVENGLLNPDYTPNEALAAQMGWELRDPNEEAELEAEHEAARTAHEVAHPAVEPTRASSQDG